MNRNGYSMAWAPAQSRSLPTPFSSKSATLGQIKPTIHDYQLLAIGTDIVVGIGAAYLASLLTRAENRWATFWWVVTGISGVKMLHDFSRKE